MSKIEKFEGDLFWDEADPEAVVDDPDDALDNLYQVGAIVEYEQPWRNACLTSSACIVEKMNVEQQFTNTSPRGKKRKHEPRRPAGRKHDAR